MMLRYKLQHLWFHRYLSRLFHMFCVVCYSPNICFSHVLCGLLLIKQLFFHGLFRLLITKQLFFPCSVLSVTHQTAVFPMVCVVWYSPNSFFLSPCVQCKGLRYFVLKLQKCSKTQHTIEAEIFLWNISTHRSQEKLRLYH